MVIAPSVVNLVGWWLAGWMLMMLCSCGEPTNTANKTRACLEENGVCYPHKSVILEQIVNYSKDGLLQWKRGEPVNAHVGIYVESLSRFLTSQMSFDMDIYIRISWKDERLVHSYDTPFLIEDIPDMNKIWKPDVYFGNAIKTEYQMITEPNMVMRIFADGTVQFSTRIVLTLSCNQDLKRYPMDTQECYIRMLSYSHPVERLSIKWLTIDPIIYNKDIVLPELQLLTMKADYCDGTYMYVQTENHTLVGNFSCLLAKIRLQRQIGYHLVQTYIPTMLIVVISWVSFWIDPNAIPARISLSFTTLLTLSTMAAGVRVALPPVAYTKAIDLWMGVCMGFVFLALIEFALVNSFMRKSIKMNDAVQKTLTAMQFSNEKSPGEAALQTNNNAVGTPTKSAKEPPLNAEMMFLKHYEDTQHKKNAYEKLPLIELQRLRMKYRHLASGLDFTCALGFPAVFGLFNILYWSLYMVQEHELD